MSSNLALKETASKEATAAPAATTPAPSKVPNKPTEQITSFSELGLPENLCSLVKELGYEVPTPIQVRSIPPLLAGKDLIGQAQTGTGKTAAFALPLISKIDFSLAEPQVLVLTPTRELAIQVAEAFQTYARNDKAFHVLPIYGGQSIGNQLRQLRRNPQVIVGTPGRVMDHLRRESLSLSFLNSLVIDEADEMLSMGFLEDMEWIITHTPKEKQTALFSATMPREIRRIAQSYLRTPEEIVIRQVATQAALINQTCWFVSGFQKLESLTRILELNEFDAVLVFVRTKNATTEIAEKLEARGYAAGALNGDMNQDARERTIDRLKQGRLDIVVATDVAARGLDVERVSHVINYDLPFDAESYTHRIGRTGRAGRSGTAISFVSDREQGLLRSIERGTGKRLEKYPMPTKEDINRRRTEKFKAKISAVFLKNKYAPYLELIESMASENQTSEKDIAAVLCSLLQEKSDEVKAAEAKESTKKDETFKARPSKYRANGDRDGRGRRDSRPFGVRSYKGPEKRDGKPSKKAEKNQKWRERVESKGAGDRRKIPK